MVSGELELGAWGGEHGGEQLTILPDELAGGREGGEVADVAGHVDGVADEGIKMGLNLHR